MKTKTLFKNSILILLLFFTKFENAWSASESGLNAGTCAQKLAELKNVCSTNAVDATSSCDDSQNSGLAQAQQVVVTLGKQVSASIAAACSTMGRISQVANAATAAYQLSCSVSVGNCTSACNSALQYYNSCATAGFTNGTLQTAIKDTLKTCSGLQSKAAQAQQAVQNLLQTALQAQNCASDSSGTSTTDFCVANPSLAGCTTTTVTDCTSAEMADNQVCICAANPNSAACLSATSASSVTSSASTAVRTTSTTSDSNIGDLYGTPEITQAALNKSASESGIDGKQGSGTSFGSTGGFDSSAGGRSAKGGSEGSEASSVNSGFYGGGGSSSSSSGGISRGEGTVANLDSNGSPAANRETTDLRKFLPGGQFDPKARGIAGAIGEDGITGPNSDIWQKVKNRYRLVTPTLMP